MKATVLRSCLALAGGCALSAHLCAERADPVAVSANARADYVLRRRPGDGTRARTESYLFAQGRFFSGEYADRFLERTAFMDIARTLAPALARQEYYPSGDRNNADLLIIVHWGATDADQQGQGLARDVFFRDLFASADRANAQFAAQGISDPSLANMALDTVGSQQASDTRSMEANARLLGYTGAMLKAERDSASSPDGLTQEDHDLSDDLLEERYFVILMAYDLNSLRNHGKPVLLWSTHVSMRSAGHNFETALPYMSRVAGNFFGHQRDALMVDAAHAPGEGKVTVGSATEVGDPASHPAGAR